MPDTVQDIVTDALTEIGVLAPGEVASAADAAIGLRRLNQILDMCAARKLYAYTQLFSSHTLTPNLNPHLIGPTGSTTLVVTQRPVRIESASLILNNVSPNVDVPINIRDKDWYAQQSVKPLTSSVPTDLYYQPDFADGKIYLWPVPTTAYGLRLETWGLLSQFAAITEAFSMPPGYRNALMLTLAEALCNPFGAKPTELLVRQAHAGRMAIQGNNNKSPRNQTADFGMPGARRGSGSGFNYYSGK